jgi:hypothetical protein
LKLEFHGTKVTSDAGLLAYRELDEAFGLTRTEGFEISDSQAGDNTRHSISALLMQSIYSRLAGYEHTNDAGTCGLILRCGTAPVEVPQNIGLL